MSVHLQKQIDHLKKMILALGTQVEEMVQLALDAVEKRDPDIARSVVEKDQRVDEMEVEVEEECLHTLALHQPFAFDLRYIIATLKINNDLERMADLAANTARQASELAHMPPVTPLPFDLPRMGQLVRSMVKQSLDALVNIDPELAERVIARDAEVDEIHRQMYQAIQKAIEREPHRTSALLYLASISRNLERIGDHAQNVAEDVIYTARGEIHRHRKSE